MSRSVGRPRRPSKLDAATKARILGAIRAGCTIEAACEFGGIHPSTYHRWLERAQDPTQSSVYRDFCEELRRAQVEAKVSMTLEIRQEDDWRAKAWILERRHPDEYGKQDRHIVSGDPNRPVLVQAKRELLDEGRDRAQRLLPEAREA